jgi:hypothetical protein
LGPDRSEFSIFHSGTKIIHRTIPLIFARLLKRSLWKIMPGAIELIWLVEHILWCAGTLFGCAAFRNCIVENL